MGLRDAKNAVVGGFEASTLYKFVNKGDYFEGTLVGAKTVVFTNSKFGDGPVLYYEFRNVSVNNVADPDTNGLYALKAGGYLKNRMKKAFKEKLGHDSLMKGYRVGLEYEGKEKNNFGTMSDAHIVFVSKADIDQAWLTKEGLSAPAMIEVADGGTDEDYEVPVAQPVATSAPIPVNVEKPSFFGSEAPAPAVSLSVPEMESKIMEIMAGKYGCKDLNEGKMKAMEIAGLLWTAANVPAIYEKVNA